MLAILSGYHQRSAFASSTTAATPFAMVTSLALNEFGDFPMMRRMLLTLKQRTERANR